MYLYYYVPSYQCGRNEADFFPIWLVFMIVFGFLNFFTERTQIYIAFGI